MQGQKGTIGNLPEGLTMEHGSSSSDSRVVEQQICWNNYMRNPSNQETQNISMWSMGESSSNSVLNSASHDRIDPKTAEHGWPPANMPITHNHGPLLVQNSHLETIPHNVTLNVNPSTFIPIKPSSFPGSSSSNPFEIDGQGQGHLRHLPCKRKVAELSVGQSSSSNMFHNPDPLNDLPTDQIIPRLGLGVGSDIENTRRNVRIRINNSRQQEPINVSSPNPSLRLNTVDLRSPPVTITPENSNSLTQERQPALRVPALRRNMHGSSRWSRNRSSDNSRTMPTNISEHPIFVPPPTAINWGLNSGGNGGPASSNPVPASSSIIPNLPLNRGSPPHYPSRRLSEILRRSLLSSMDSSVGGGGLSGNLFARAPPAGGTSETGVPPVVGVPGHHHHRHHLLPHSRSSDRLDAAFGFPHLARNVAAGSEGRGRLVSEIRNVLDLIRRGEGLRFEDVMILDQSVFFGMADMHDRHRDMRLDIDNMSYEELLALEERIGNVNTGLKEETISSCLKQKTYMTVADAEPCCICQEEYKNGDDLGGLECGHDFHASCIKQWLLQKNLCPVCKSAACATSK